MQESVWEFYCSSVCLNLFWFRFNACFTYEKTVINRRRVEKSAFGDQSEENSVWIIKWTTLSGIFCEKSFAPAVTSCYQVHADPHLSVAVLHYLGATGAETSLLLTAYCIEVLTLSTLHARNSSYMHGRNLEGDTTFSGGGDIVCDVPPTFSLQVLYLEKFQKQKWRLPRFVWSVYHVRYYT